MEIVESDLEQYTARYTDLNASAKALAREIGSQGGLFIQRVGLGMWHVILQ